MVNGVLTLFLVSLVIMVILQYLQFFLSTNHCGTNSLLERRKE